MSGEEDFEKRPVRSDVGTERPRFASRDPYTFFVSLAAWSIFNAATLLWTGKVFEANPAYRFLKTLPIPETGWGWVMAMDAACVVACLFRASQELRATVAVLSGMFWFCYGSLLMVGSLFSGPPVFLSVVAAFSVFNAVLCFHAAGQWGYQRDSR